MKKKIIKLRIQAKNYQESEKHKSAESEIYQEFRAK